MKKSALALLIVVAVVGGSSVAWASVRASGGSALCVPTTGAVTAPQPSGECARGATRVEVAGADDVAALVARVSALEEQAGAPAAVGAAGASEAHIVTQNWFSAACNEENWLFVNCKTDHNAAQFAGGPPSQLNVHYGMTIDGSRYPEGTTWTMDLRFRTTAATCIRLFDVTANTVVAGSEHCVTGTEAAPNVGRSASAPFTLPAEPHDYLPQAWNKLTCPWGPSVCWPSGSIVVRELVARW